MREALDRAIGETPPSFALRMDQTLLQLKEESHMKPMKLRTILALAMIALLLCATAAALVAQGLDWYYNHRFTAYRQHEPERHDALLQGRQTAVPQDAPEDPDVTVEVTEVAWAEAQRTLAVIVSARARSEMAVLHPLHNLNPDGETRDVHWLWTEAGFGPVAEVIPAGRTLLLWAADTVLLDGAALLGDGSFCDAYVTEDGTVQTVIELRLDEAAAERLRARADGEGMVHLTLPYAVTPCPEAGALPAGRGGEIAFRVKIR